MKDYVGVINVQLIDLKYLNSEKWAKVIKMKANSFFKSMKI